MSDGTGRRVGGRKVRALIGVVFAVLGFGTAEALAAWFEGVPAPEPVPVQIWEDGSGRFRSGTVTVDGRTLDLAGWTFCLSGEPCAD